MAPLVSIITPSFNQVDFLEKTIQSVIDQGYAPIEYILVDGGSTDGSLEIIKKYSTHFSEWISEPDQGQAEAINKGLQRASGEIIAWLNSDDVYRPGAIQKVVDFFEANPEVGFVFGDMLAIDENGIQINTLRYGDYSIEGLMTFHIIGQPAVFFRKEVLDNSGLLDLSYQYLLDHHLWLRMASYTQMRYIPEILASARYHSGAKNVAAAEKFGEEAYRISDWMKEYEGTKDLYPGLDRKIRAGASLIDGRYLLDGGKPWASFKAYLRSLTLHPPTGLREIHRMAFALAASLGLVKVRNVVERRHSMNAMKERLRRK